MHQFFHESGDVHDGYGCCGIVGKLKRKPRGRMVCTGEVEGEEMVWFGKYWSANGHGGGNGGGGVDGRGGRRIWEGMKVRVGLG